MAELITLFCQGEVWAEAGADGFSNETGGYPPGWGESASPEELVAAHAARVNVPITPVGKILLGRSIQVEDFAPVVVLDLRDYTSEELAALHSQRIGEVKAEAGRRILERYPTWKQANMNMRATELVDIRLDRELTEAETAEREAMLSAAAWIKEVRAASDAIEAALPDDAEGLCAFIAATADGWPA